MINYVITFSIISLCSSTRIVGDYDELILSQRSPTAAHCYLQDKMRDGTISTNDVIAYLTEYWMVLNPKTWIANELRSTDRNGETLTECHTHTGAELRYHDMIPPKTFTENLRRKWPAFCLDLTLDELWELDFDIYGSCIQSVPLYYFELAIRLLDNYNIGEILHRYGIVPGQSYDLDFIKQSITEELQVYSYVKCLPAQNRDSRNQFLFEVEICFNREHNLINCHHAVQNLCDANKTVVYPGWPIHF